MSECAGFNVPHSLHETAEASSVRAVVSRRSALYYSRNVAYNYDASIVDLTEAVPLRPL